MDQMSHDSSYFAPTITSGDRYWRVWMSSEKCLSSQQAFPRSAIFATKLLVLGFRVIFSASSAAMSDPGSCSSPSRPFAAAPWPWPPPPGALSPAFGRRLLRFRWCADTRLPRLRFSWDTIRSVSRSIWRISFGDRNCCSCLRRKFSGLRSVWITEHFEWRNWSPSSICFAITFPACTVTPLNLVFLIRVSRLLAIISKTRQTCRPLGPNIANVSSSFTTYSLPTPKESLSCLRIFTSSSAASVYL
mmetsp:Transcript_4273/g.10013  ORF Transcript_4273/g.10013 Transcript_4273/m.10013 type:complete len:246 (+) Transcript_4273:199-936(+)